MPKRKRSTRRTYTARKRARTMPRRAYKRSMVPLSSRGYSFDAPEVKTFDVASTTNLADANTASIQSIITTVQGTGFTNRIGTRIKVKSIYVRGWLSTSNAFANPPTDADTPAYQCRVTLLLDLQPNGANPTISEIYDNTGPVSHLNLNYRDRFKVLKEKTYTIDPYIVNTTTAYAAVTNNAKTMKFFKKCDIPVFYNSGNAGTPADISSNNILLVFQSDRPNGTGGTVFKWTSRCRFIDP